MSKKLLVENIYKVFENGDGIKGVSFEVEEGEFLTLLGPSGCGKTTILRAIGGFNDIDSGKIIINGQEVQDRKPEAIPTSMVFQGYNLWPHMSVYKNLAFGLKIRKLDKKEIDRRIKETLDMLHILDQINKSPEKLSGGQKQRVAIARSLVLNPSVLLLDEPFSALDAKIRKQMRKEIKRIQQETGITIVFVTHDQEEAMGLSDRIIVMNKSKIEQIGSPKEIYESPATEFVANFIGEMNNMSTGNTTISFRPEDIELSSSGEYQAEISAITLAGHYLTLDLVRNDENLTLFIEKNSIDYYKKGDLIKFNITKKHIYVDGKRVEGFRIAV